MRTHPALRVTFFDSPTQEQLDQLLAELDDYGPTALEDVAGGVVAYFANATARDAALARFSALELLDVIAEDVSDENWAERSQAALTPVTVGRLTISPPWAATSELRASAPGPVIVIQPSMGFGTGHHASTRLCLELLQQIPLAGKRVLDIGTGSGVLAIAAHLLGAKDVVGIDIDPDALANARENLALNGVTEGVTFVESDLHARARLAPQGYDVVLANLTGAVLQREVDAITSVAAAPARLIVSGFEIHEADDVRTAFTNTGWTALGQIHRESWVASLLGRG